MGRFKKKKRFKIKSSIIIILITILIIFITLTIRTIGKKMEPGLLNYAEKESKKLITIIVRGSIDSKEISMLNKDNLFIINEKINSIDINNEVINTYLKDITNNIQYNLKCIEEGNIDNLSIDKRLLARYDEDNLKKGIFTTMPTGVIFNNPLLINLSPNIPLKMSFIGNVETDIESKITNYGINNALIELNLKVITSIQVLLPVRSKETIVELKYPIVTKLINGKTPNLYYGDLLNK